MPSRSALPRAWGFRQLAVAAVSSLLLLVGAGFFTERAAALVPVVDDNAGMLTLLADSNPLQVPQLLPGEAGYVQIGAVLVGPDSGSLALEIRKDGDLMDSNSGMTISVSRCDVEWQGVSAVPPAAVPTCAQGEAPVLTAAPTDDYSVSSPVWDLDGITSVAGKYLLLSFDFNPPTLGSGDPGWARSGSYSVRLMAAGDTSTTAAPPSLILTGADALPLALAAAGLLGLGVASLSAARRRAAA